MYAVFKWAKWEYQWVPAFADRDEGQVYVWPSRAAAQKWLDAMGFAPSPSGKPAHVVAFDPSWEWKPVPFDPAF